MALTPSYAESLTLKKLTVGGATYFLKDADLRTLVESFGSVVYKDVVTTFDADGVDVATEKATADYIKEQIAGLEGAMHFVGVVTRTEGQTDRQAIDAFYTAKGAVPAAGDVLIMQDNGKEYICSNKGTGIADATWEEVGDQNIYETIAHAAATYVTKTTTVAGIALDHNITATELSASTALDLKALAHKDSASGTVEVLDDIDNITVGKAGSYNVTDQETVDVPQTYNALDVTPAGTVDITPGTAAAATYQKTSAAAISSAQVAEGQSANYTPAGSVSLPGLTASVTLTPTDVATVTDAGTAYSLTDGAVTKADDSKSKFVKKGVSFEVNESNEELTLAYVANTDTNFYADAVTAAGDVTYTKQTLSGSLPTFGTQAVALTTGATASASYDGNASFTGEGTVLSAALSYATDDAVVTQPTFTADFNGTSKSVTPSAATTSPAAVAGGKITVAEQDTAITANKKTATVTVS